MVEKKSGYVYLAKAEGTNLYKVGVTTRNIEDRFKELNGKQSPYKIECVGYFWSDDAYGFEKHIHDTHEEYHHHNEWFQLPSSVSLELLRYYEHWRENGESVGAGSRREEGMPSKNLHQEKLPDFPRFTFPWVRIAIVFFSLLFIAKESITPRCSISEERNGQCEVIK